MSAAIEIINSVIIIHKETLTKLFNGFKKSADKFCLCSVSSFFSF